MKKNNTKVEQRSRRSEHKTKKQLPGCTYFFLKGVKRSKHFSARQHIRYNVLYSVACPSICLSVTRVDQSKTAEVSIMQLSPQSSPMTLGSSWLTSPRNSKGNIIKIMERGHQ